MGYLFKCTIPIQFSFLASVLLFILSSWQIPLFMYVSMRFSTSFAVIISLVCIFLGIIIGYSLVEISKVTTSDETTDYIISCEKVR